MKKANRRALIVERANNLRKARETADLLLWAWAIIQRNRQLGIQC